MVNPLTIPVIVFFLLLAVALAIALVRENKAKEPPQSDETAKPDPTPIEKDIATYQEKMLDLPPRRNFAQGLEHAPWRPEMFDYHPHAFPTDPRSVRGVESFTDRFNADDLPAAMDWYFDRLKDADLNAARLPYQFPDSGPSPQLPSDAPLALPPGDPKEDD
jgi:hypothetical protein